MIDSVSAGQTYDGTTTQQAPISYDANGRTVCPTTFDNVNTVFFGDRQPGVLASTCSKSIANPSSFDQIVAADMEIDKTAFSWTTLPTSPGCAGEYDLEGIITHEFGHWYGLGHVLGSPSLTMHNYVPPPCSLPWRTLGEGDVLGLRQMY